MIKLYRLVCKLTESIYLLSIVALTYLGVNRLLNKDFRWFLVSVLGLCAMIYIHYLDEDRRRYMDIVERLKSTIVGIGDPYNK